MTTELKKPVKRQTTHAVDNRRKVVVTLYPGDTIGFRLHRTRTEYVTSIAACYCMAVAQEVARKGRRGAA